MVQVLNEKHVMKFRTTAASLALTMLVAGGCAGSDGTPPAARAADTDGCNCGTSASPVYAPVSDDTPENVRSFLGRGGDGTDKWEGALCHVLDVEEVRADGSMSGLYVVGEARQWGIPAPPTYDVVGSIVGNEMTSSLPGEYVDLHYVMAGDGSELAGTYQNRRVARYTGKITLRRVARAP
jgi:hypothetical protein